MKIKYEIQKLFLVSLREMFARDIEFPYNKDDTLTSIIISSEFPVKSVEDKKPHIVLHGISYTTGQDSFYNNFQKESAPGTKTYSKVVGVGCSFSIYSSNVLECERVGDILFNYLNHTYHDIFQNLGINIRNISVSPSGLKGISPQEDYTQRVDIQGDMRLSWNVTMQDQSILSLIKLNLENF